MLFAEKPASLQNAGCNRLEGSSPRSAVLRLLDGLSAVRAKELIGRLTSNSEKAVVATSLLKSVTLSEPAQEMLIAVLAETGTYQQHVSVLDSGKLTSGAALDALKKRIRAFSDSVIVHSSPPSYPKK